VFEYRLKYNALNKSRPVEENLEVDPSLKKESRSQTIFSRVKWHENGAAKQLF